MLLITIIIPILLTFPTIPNTVSAVCHTINHSHSSTYDFYRCSYTNLGILIPLSLTSQYLTHARYLNVAQITTFLLSTIETFLVVCFQNIPPASSASLSLAASFCFFPTFPSLFSVFLHFFYTTVF